MDERRHNQLLLYFDKARNSGTNGLRESIVWMRPRACIAAQETLWPLPVIDQDGSIYHTPANTELDEMIWVAMIYFERLVREASFRLR